MKTFYISNLKSESIAVFRYFGTIKEEEKEKALEKAEQETENTFKKYFQMLQAEKIKGFYICQNYGFYKTFEVYHQSPKQADTIQKSIFYTAQNGEIIPQSDSQLKTFKDAINDGIKSGCYCLI